MPYKTLMEVSYYVAKVNVAGFQENSRQRTDDNPCPVPQSGTQLSQTNTQIIVVYDVTHLIIILSIFTKRFLGPTTFEER